jgi:RNA polymerase primary sigma factor
MTRAISVYYLWSSSTADIYGKSLTREERKKEWDRFEKKHPEDFAKLQRKADRENKKAGVETKKTKATKATKATKKTTKKESVKCADGVCKKRAPRKQSLTTLQKKLVTAERNLKKATQAVSDIKADIKKRKEEEEEEEEADSSSEDEDSSSEEEDSDSDSDDE